MRVGRISTGAQQRVAQPLAERRTTRFAAHDDIEACLAGLVGERGKEGRLPDALAALDGDEAAGACGHAG